jgi:hypothetical protein
MADAIGKLFNSGTCLAMALTGGGSLLLPRLFSRPGASRFLIEAQIPYHAAALDDYLGRSGPHPAVEETARIMALEAWRRAGRFTTTAPAVGFGLSAALATERVRRGQDRAHLAIRSAAGYFALTLSWKKEGPDQGARTRLSQEEELNRSALEMLSWACAEGEAVAGASRWPLAVDLEDLLEGRLALVENSDVGIRAVGPQSGRLIFPGSFNPLHEGHELLARTASRLSGLAPLLEISVENVDKPSLSYAELWRRLQGIGGRFTVMLSRAATFVEKARLFPEGVFVIGTDTAERLFSEQYYIGGAEGMRRALDEIVGLGCRFLVAGRLGVAGFVTLEDLELPASYAGIFTSIPADQFRRDISSTQIRSADTG